jgi:hypothetical protein
MIQIRISKGRGQKRARKEWQEYGYKNDSKESIPPSHVDWWAGTTTLLVVPARQAT